MINEIWKDVPGYEGLYQVSNLGEVRSLPRYEKDKNNKLYKRKGVILKQSKTTTGYWKVELCKNGTRKSLKVHRLVALAFIVNTFNKPFINHKDGNPLNNIVDNLEWCTQSENIQHAHDTGLINNFQNKLDHNEVIREYLNNSKTEEICRKFNISKTVLYGILKKHNIKRRTNAEHLNKYDLDLKEVLNDLKSGMKNVDIAKKHNCTTQLISVRKYQFKKGGLL